MDDGPFEPSGLLPELGEDHAGEGETSLMMALSPEAVDMKRHSPKKWYTKSARHASPDLGGTAAAEEPALGAGLRVAGS